MKRVTLILSLVLLIMFTILLNFNSKSDAEEANVEELQTLFETYYNNGVYVKDTVINVNEDVQKEIEEFCETLENTGVSGDCGQCGKRG
mgnify:CR=1 FL=1